MTDLEQNRLAKMCARTMGQECIAMRARLISRTISRIYDKALSTHGLKGSQMSILAIVSVLGRAEPSNICRLLQLDVSTLSRNVTRMKSKGWLKASPTEDRRAHLLELTSEGERILVEAFSSWQDAQGKVAEILGEENAAAIRKVAGALWAKSAVL